MAKRAAPAPKQEPECNQQLVNAIIAVKHLQGFIQDHGGVEQAIAAVSRVNHLIELTGGVESLKQALEVVGKPADAPQG